jgi:hypothetical protein
LRPHLLYNRKTSRLRRVWVTDNGGVSGAAAGLELTELNWVHSTKTASLHTIAICLYTNKHKGRGVNPNLADFLDTKDQESGERIYTEENPGTQPISHQVQLMCHTETAAKYRASTVNVPPIAKGTS